MAKNLSIAPADIKIIPGAMQPSSSFDRFKKCLEEDNHTVRVYDLPISDATLTVNDYAEIINKDIEKTRQAGKLTIVLANSRGGRTLVRTNGDVHVFVNCGVPLAKDQQGLAISAPDSVNPEYIDCLVPDSDTGLSTIGFEDACKFFYQNLPAELATEEFARLIPQNRKDAKVKPLETQPDVANIVIGSRADRVVLPAYTEWMAVNVLGMTAENVYWLNAGHLPHLEEPELLKQTVYQGVRDLGLG